MSIKGPVGAEGRPNKRWRLIGGILILGILVFGAVGLAADWYVDDDSPTGGDGTTSAITGDHRAFHTIGDAITAAAAYDTVNVNDGTYVEDVTVTTDNLTLQSENGKDTTTIEGGMTLNAAADDFTLGGATDKGFTLNTGANFIYVNNPTDVEISYNTIDTAGGGAWGSRGINISNAGATGLTVTYNDFLLPDLYDQGIRNDWAGADLVGLTVSNNTFTGTDNTLETSAIEICSLDISTVDSTFSGNTMDTVGNGVLIGSDQGGGLLCGTGTLEISGNTFDECNYGIDLVNATATGVDQNVVVRWNTFSDGNYGFAIDYGTYPADGDPDPIGGNWEPGDFTVEYNNFSGNTDYGIYNNVATAVTAENNWWGDASGPGPVGPGTGDKVSANVDYDPWLGAGVGETKSETVTGSGTVTNTPTGGDVTINATGDHTVTTIKYESNPGGTTSFSASGNYYDVHLDSTANVNSLTVEFCPATPTTVIYYWDGTSWQCASDQTYANGCITVTITATTLPSLSDLTGLPFGSGSALTLGDINGDGYIDVLDTRLCLQIATGFLTPTAAQEAAADVDEDGDVDRDDAELLAKYIIGMVGKLGGG